MKYIDTQEHLSDMRNEDGSCVHQGACRHQTNPIDRRCTLIREFTTRYPHLDRALIDTFVQYQMDREANGGHNVTQPPIVPDRITARHPMAH